MTPTTQLRGEQNKAYEAFRLYLNMGQKRSHRRVAQKLRKSVTFISRLARRHKWKERVSASLLEDRQIEMDAKAKAALEAARELERRQAEVRENSWTLYKEALHIARKLLSQPFTNESPASAARLVAVADALGRMAAGMPSKVTGLTDIEGKQFTMPTQAAPTTIVVNVKRDADSDAAVKLFGQRPADRRPKAGA